MPIPLIPIITVLTPVVLKAFDLFQKRSTALAERETRGNDAGSAASLSTRMKELEASDIEQARLISELSVSLEKLARAAEANLQENKRLTRKCERLTWIALSVAIVSCAATGWLLWII
jgi:uncharacterized coiled-coil protein SlyX